MGVVGSAPTVEAALGALARELSSSTEQSSRQLKELLELEQKQLDELMLARESRDQAAQAAEDEGPVGDGQDEQLEATAELVEQVKGTRSLALTSGGLSIFLLAVIAMRSRK